MAARVRPYLFYAATRALCGECLRVVDAKEIIEDGCVFLWKRCPHHGVEKVLLSDDVAYFRLGREAFLKSPEQVSAYNTGFRHGCPYDCGICPDHEQHGCVSVLEITDHCNLRCPTCFAESSPAASAVAPLADVLASVDARLAKENDRIDVLMLSGGEPTLDPWLEQLLEHLVTRPIVRILINSNGLRIANDDAFVETLKRHRERVEIYLQFDGESAEASAFHRGADIRRFKERALERLSDAGVFTTLTMTAALGVNDGEIGAVIRRAMQTPYVGGVTIQPVFGSGRSAGIDPDDRLTHTGVLARLEPQTEGQVTWRDLTALPCSHPHCCSVGYLLQDDAGEWKSLTALIGHERLKQFLDLEPDLLANRIADSNVNRAIREVVKNSLLDLLSEQSSLSHPSMSSIWTDICQNCDLGIGTLATLAASGLPGQHKRLRTMLGERVKRITVKPFMDINTMIEERLTQCCVHVATVNETTEAHQCAPFCAVQAWAPLARRKLSTVTGGRRELPVTVST